jgi:molybdenum cofactor cytidylyltransferase
MERSPRLAAVVLAAGAGSRFSDQPGGKLLALLDGRPILQHVLAEVRDFGPTATVVVLGHGAARIESSIDWAAEDRVINPDPDRGLASSLRVGIEALRRDAPEVDGAFVILGDQPLVRADVMHSLATAASEMATANPAALVPRYDAGEGARNPVLLLRPAWAWVDRTHGDHGLGPLIDSKPDSVLEVPVHGSMPDVDTPADLRRLTRPR